MVMKQSLLVKYIILPIVVIPLERQDDRHIALAYHVLEGDGNLSNPVSVAKVFYTVVCLSPHPI